MTTLVLIAESTADGRAWLSDQPAPPLDVVIVTPRARDRARGIRADLVLWTPAARDLWPALREQLLAVTLPCVA